LGDIDLWSNTPIENGLVNFPNENSRHANGASIIPWEEA
jgi:hypothetical protein